MPRSRNTVVHPSAACEVRKLSARILLDHVQPRHLASLFLVAMPGAPSSVLVTTSKAPVTTSVALVTTSVAPVGVK